MFGFHPYEQADAGKELEIDCFYFISIQFSQRVGESFTELAG